MGLELQGGQSEENALGRENVTVVEGPAFAESREQKVVLQPGADCKGDEEDVQVNIIGNGCMGSGSKGVEDAYEDLTDTECSSSSSFGDTGSGLETASGSAFSDSEVESPMGDDWSKPLRLRKKKVTFHWRRFIHPLVWRCKWIELQLKKLNSQALKYEKELAAYDYRKQLEFLKFAVDGFDVKSVPMSDGVQRHNKVMKRKKRKRAEECDLSSYVSNHSVFSYYENKNRSHDACLEDFCGGTMKGNADNTEEFKLNDMWSSVDHEDNDKSFIDIIQKIEELMPQVEKLKTRIGNVISENPVSFVHASSQHQSELYMEDLLMAENTLSTHVGINPFIETTYRPQLEVLRENTKDEVLIQNQAANEELHDLENVRNQLVEKSNESVEEHKSISPAQVSESDLAAENAVPNAHSTLKACSTSKSNFPRNTRKGRKKSGTRS